MAERKAASVFPEPVGAWMRTWPPSAIAGHPCACAGVGAAKFRSNQARVSGRKTSSGSMHRAERAVRAALAIRDSIGDELQIRTAVNTGEALVALGARPGEGDAMVAGDVVNTAARLQGAAPVNGILVGEGTYRATRHAIDYREAASVEAKG